MRSDTVSARCHHWERACHGRGRAGMLGGDSRPASQAPQLQRCNKAHQILSTRALCCSPARLPFWLLLYASISVRERTPTSGSELGKRACGSGAHAAPATTAQYDTIAISLCLCMSFYNVQTIPLPCPAVSCRLPCSRPACCWVPFPPPPLAQPARGGPLRRADGTERARHEAGRTTRQEGRASRRNPLQQMKITIPSRATAGNGQQQQQQSPPSAGPAGRATIKIKQQQGAAAQHDGNVASSSGTASQQHPPPPPSAAAASSTAATPSFNYPGAQQQQQQQQLLSNGHNAVGESSVGASQLWMPCSIPQGRQAEKTLATSTDGKTETRQPYSEHPRCGQPERAGTRSGYRSEA